MFVKISTSIVSKYGIPIPSHGKIIALTASTVYCIVSCSLLFWGRSAARPIERISRGSPDRKAFGWDDSLCGGSSWSIINFQVPSKKLCHILSSISDSHFGNVDKAKWLFIIWANPYPIRHYLLWRRRPLILSSHWYAISLSSCDPIHFPNSVLGYAAVQYL